MLIPSVLALSDFFIKNVPNNFWWYPYWYLGNPFQYLIGPVVPSLLLLFHKVFPAFPISSSYLLLIIGSLIVGGSGMYVLVRHLGGGEKESRFSALFFLTLPFYFLLLTTGNGLHHVAFGFLPWVFILYARMVDFSMHERNSAASLFLSLGVALLLLIDISIILPLVIGFICLAIACQIYQKRGVGYVFIKTVFILMVSLSLSTLWYTPTFWWTVLTNPSFGGFPLLNLAHFLFQLLLNLLPIVLAVVFVKWRRVKLSRPLLFGALFFSSFLFLTLVRFLSDPDFVMDWIGFLLELQFGMSMVLGSVFGLLLQKKRAWIGLAFRVLIIAGLGSSFLLIRGMKDPLQSEYQNRLVSMVKANAAADVFSVGGYESSNLNRVFFSGSSVFWINYRLSIPQVRGAADSFAAHPFWHHGAYQIREGKSAEIARSWLMALGASYVLVHEGDSEEPFRDFKNTRKYAPYQNGTGQADFKLVTTEKGDALYKIEGTSLAHLASKKILDVAKPKDGADERALSEYISTFQKPFAIYFDAPNKIIFGGDLKEDELISLAVTYHPSWQITQGKGKIVSDSLGNMVIVPKDPGRQKFTLLYSNHLIDSVMPGIFLFVIFVSLFFFDTVYPYLLRPFSKLSFGLEETQE